MSGQLAFGPTLGVVTPGVSRGGAQETGAQWHAQLTLYGRAAGVGGEIGPFRGAPKRSFERSFSEILDDLDAAFFATGLVRFDRLVLFGDVSYAEASRGGVVPPGVNGTGRGTSRSLRPRSPQAGGRAIDEPALAIDLLGGVRAGSVETRVETPALGVDASSNKTFVDPIVRLRINRRIADRWAVLGCADVGGAGGSSEPTYRLALASNRQASEHAFLPAGYRHLHLDHQDDGAGIEAGMSGPPVGATRRFRTAGIDRRAVSARTSMSTMAATPKWTWATPVIALGLGIVGEAVLHGDTGPTFFLLSLPFLFAAVFSAVHHAETIAHRIGQPFGSIVLALAVTLIEVSLIASVLLSAPGGESAVARDTVFAAIMIVLNGIVGLCLFVGGVRHHAQGFQASSASAALGVLGTLAVLALVLPNFTRAEPGPVYAPSQLAFVAVVSLLLYGMFLYVQTSRHRDDFLEADAQDDAHGPVDRRAFLTGLGLLPVALLGVVLLAEVLSHQVDDAIARAGLPEALVGVAIALIVLMPEGVAALRAARANRLQLSLNLALGSALASLCLTIPTVALISLALGQTLILGLEGEHIVLLVLSLFMATLSLASGRTTILQGGIHLVIFGAFITISAIP